MAGGLRAFGFQQAKDTFAHLDKFFSPADQTERLKAVGQAGVASILMNFEVGGRPEKWDQLAVSSMRAYLFLRQRTHKRRDYLGNKASRIISNKKILISTRRLMRSIKARVFGNRMELYTSLYYASMHQLGDTKRHIPARPFLVLQEEDADNALSIWNTGLGKALQK